MGEGFRAAAGWEMRVFMLKFHDNEADLKIAIRDKDLLLKYHNRSNYSASLKTLTASQRGK